MLLVTVVWTVIVLADIQAPGARPAVTIEITGRQWWWQVRYIGDDGAQGFTTANEIHIPAGQPVRLKLMGGDVIHSFWVPQLAGKMDAIPGQINETWIEADAPGIYTRAMHRILRRAAFQDAAAGGGAVAAAISAPGGRISWLRRRVDAGQRIRRALRRLPCGARHGSANGTMGPDLSHLMQRRTLASGALPNDAADPGALDRRSARR